VARQPVQAVREWRSRTRKTQSQKARRGCTLDSSSKADTPTEQRKQCSRTPAACKHGFGSIRVHRTTHPGATGSTLRPAIVAWRKPWDAKALGPSLPFAATCRGATEQCSKFFPAVFWNRQRTLTMALAKEARETKGPRDNGGRWESAPPTTRAAGSRFNSDGSHLDSPWPTLTYLDLPCQGRQKTSLRRQPPRKGTSGQAGRRTRCGVTWQAGDLARWNLSIQRLAEWPWLCATVLTRDTPEPCSHLLW